MGVPLGVGLPGVEHTECQAFAVAGEQVAAAVQPLQVLVRQAYQLVESQPLGECAELVTLRRADQAIEVLPFLQPVAGLGDLRVQRLQAAALGLIQRQLGTDLRGLISRLLHGGFAGLCLRQQLNETRVAAGRGLQFVAALA